MQALPNSNNSNNYSLIVNLVNDNNPCLIVNLVIILMIA